MARVGIRVDACERTGMGHLIECLSIAKSLEKRSRFQITFLTNPASIVRKIIKKSGYKIRTINAKNEKEEISQISDFVRKLKINILIVDLLNKKPQYFKKLKRLVKILCVILDDPKPKHIPADLVVNFNILQRRSYYRKFSNSNTIYCIGPKYMPMPEELHEKWKIKKPISNECKTIFVNQGGSDPYHLTIKILKSLERLQLKQKIIVVIGPAVSTRLKNELKKIRDNLKNDYRFEWAPDQQRMYRLMEESDIAITAAGNTLYELALCGVPSIVVSHHETHNMVGGEFARRGAAINLGIGTVLSEEEIAAAIKELIYSKEKRASLSTNAKKIVDGLGSKRIAEKVLMLCRQYL